MGGIPRAELNFSLTTTFKVGEKVTSLFSAQDRLVETRRAALAKLQGLEDTYFADLVDWRDGRVEFRYLLYRLAEADDELRVSLAEPVRELGWSPSAAQRILAQTFESRGAFLAPLSGLPDDRLDEEPEPGEWSVRQILDHCINVEQRYNLQTAYAVERFHSDQELPLRMPDDRLPPRVAAVPTPGSLTDVRRRLSEVSAGVVTGLSGLTEEELSASSGWGSMSVDVRFRLHRFAAHEREHTTQLQKTVNLIHPERSETHAVLGQAQRARGLLLAALFGIPADLAGQPRNGGRSIADLIDAAAIEEAALTEEILAKAATLAH